MAQKQDTGVKQMTCFGLDLQMVFLQPINNQLNSVQHYFNAWDKNINTV